MINGFLENLPDEESDEETVISSSSSEEDVGNIWEVARTGTQEELVKILMTNRAAKINKKEKKTERIMLHWAAELDKLDTATYLLNKNSSINALEVNGCTPLMLAVKKGLSGMCRFLLSRKADIKIRDNDCFSVLHHAVNGRFYETATLLVKKGADLNAEDHQGGRTALHIAAEKGYKELVEMLIVRGANLYATGDSLYSKTPLHLSCMNNHIECTRILCSRDADPEALSGFLDMTPLHAACEAGNLECVRALLEVCRKKPHLDRTGNRVNGDTPLLIAARRGFTAIAKYLLDAGADPVQWGRFSTVGSAVHVAARFGRADIVYMLVTQYGVSVDNREHYGNSALHIACREGHYELAKLLIQMDANVEIKALNQQTPLDLVKDPVQKEALVVAAERAGEERTFRQAVQEEAARVEAEAQAVRDEARRREDEEKEEERQRFLSIRVNFLARLRAVCDVSGELSAIVNLIEEFRDQDINGYIIEEEQCTALQRACLRGFGPIVRTLLRWPGIALDRQDAAGNTALHLAAATDNRELVETLLLLQPEPHRGLLNKQGKVAANMPSTAYLREIIRNPAIVSRRLQWQDEVERAVLRAHAGFLNLDITIGASSGRLLREGDFAANANTSSNTSNNSNSNSNNSSDRSGTQQQQLVLDAGSGIMVTAETEQFAQGRFGPVPDSFGGCRRDLFLGDDAAVRPAPPLSRLPPNTATAEQFIPLIGLQAKYTPSAFDSTAQWLDVKDLLFLLGYPYRAVRNDKRALLHRAARVLDNLQTLFTAGPADFSLLTAAAASSDPVAYPPPAGKYRSTNQSPTRGERGAGGHVLPPIHGAATAPVSWGDDEGARGGGAQQDEDLTGNGYFPPSCHFVLSPLQEERGAEGAAAAVLPAVSLQDFTRLVLLSHQCEQLWRTLLQLLETDPSTFEDRETETQAACEARADTLKARQVISGSVHAQLATLLRCGVRCVFEGFAGERSSSSSSSSGSGEAGGNDASLRASSRHIRIDLSCDATQRRIRKALVNPPRFMRVAVDAAFEACAALRKKAEASFALDAVRAHLWLENGRKILQRNIAALALVLPETLTHSLSADGGLRADSGGGGGGGGGSTDVTVVGGVRSAKHKGLQLWLQDLHLSEYERYFEGQGFKELDDFAELTEQDCADFFTFLKIGDRRRLQKAVPLLNEATVGAYEGRKEKKRKGGGKARGTRDRDHLLLSDAVTGDEKGDAERRFFPPVLPPGALGYPRIV